MSSPKRHPSSGRRWQRIVALATAAGTAAALQVAIHPSAEAAELTAPIFTVTSEGLTADQGKALADRAGVPNALRSDGSFVYQSEAFALPPLVTVGEGRGEDGAPTTSQALDRKALDAITVPSASDALALAKKLLPVASPYRATLTVGHTAVEQTNTRGSVVLTRSLDTTVSYQLTLGGRPVVGPGARMGIAFAGDGSVVKLNQAVRGVKPAGVVPIISPDEAQRRCAALYPGVDLGTPSLAYYAPALAASRASGAGAATTITPQYVCQPLDVAKDAVSALTGRLVPAAPGLTPGIIAVADYDGRTMTARADVTGGTAPYSYRWSSSTTALSTAVASRPTLSYAPRPRQKQLETVFLTVTDANGVSETLSLAPSSEPGGPGHAEASGAPGGSGGAFYEAGIEQTVDEWACAQASAQGFREVMQARSQTVNFDWRGTNAWERDFKDPSRSGNDTNFADAVDIQWYTGHGSPNSFTFKNTSRDDGNLTPADGRFGNTDLEWLNLESCQVLRDTNGSFDFFGRWGPTMTGLHLLNGFDTNATCVDGGTGRLFASYLFPQNFLFWQLPALTVSQAWGTMANSLEPAGTKWRSMSLVGAGGVNNLGDHFWGQGSTGPDLTYANRSGMIAVSGVV